MRTLRAIGARAGSWALLVAVATVSVCAVVVAAAGGDAARPATLGPLVLLTGVVAAPAGTELARRRRAEVSLVRVRGGGGPRLVSSVAGEALGAVVVGAAAGFVLGALALQVLHDRWDVDTLVAVDELAAAAVVAAAAAVPAVGAAFVVAREPLAIAVRRAGWSGPGPRLGFLGLVLGVAVVLAAALATYRATSEGPGDLVLVGPALVGLAAGQLVVWAGRAASQRAGAAGGSSLAVLLGVRRALSADHAGTLRTLVAIGTVAAAAASAVVSVDAWAEDSARLDTGAPLLVEMPDASALETLLVTQQLDPDGRWLMAAALDDARDEVAFRRAWVDLARYDRVAGDHLATTPGDLTAHVGDLRDAETVALVAGDSVTLEASRPATVTVAYLDDGGVVSSLEVRADVAAGTVDDCSRACVLLGLETSVDVEVTSLRLGGTDLVEGPVSLNPGEVWRPAAATAPEPMVAAGPTEGLVDGIAEVDGLGGSPRPLVVVDRLEALPLLGAAGLIGDLPVALAGAGGSVPAVRAIVLARADTPEGVLEGLVAAGAGPPQGWGPATRALGDRELAEERLGRVTLVTSALLGLLLLGVGRRRKAQSSARERAAFRLVGVPVRTLRRAALLETALVAGTVGMTTYLSAWLTTTTLVDGAGLVGPGPVGLAFGSVVSQPLLLAVSLATGLAAAAGLALTRRTRRHASAPAALLSEPEHL